jgi:hypothetical protein
MRQVIPLPAGFRLRPPLPRTREDEPPDERTLGHQDGDRPDDLPPDPPELEESSRIGASTEGRSQLDLCLG